jgi:peptidoglycan/LPS O-acetylase OafA/YrhL
LLCGSLKYAIFIAFSSSLGVLAEGLHLGPWSVASFVPQLLYRVFVFLGNHSLELYLVHEFIFFALQISCEQVNPYCLLALGFMLSCLSAYITKLAVNKIMPQ